jgi:hypothetical protein
MVPVPRRVTTVTRWGEAPFLALFLKCKFTPIVPSDIIKRRIWKFFFVNGLSLKRNTYEK